ncbi:MAG: precorrin-6y C5,15-methyltransferase (decarboxylating) subunit CbiE [Steroidobacteraceae bacterium]
MSGLNPNTIAPQTAGQGPTRWLSIVGIGEEGIDGLGELARGLIESAEIVYGGSRHLALAAPLIHGTTRIWGSPFEASVAEVLNYRGRPVCVLASGDPFQHGIGSVLARHVAADETIAVPAVSAFTLAACRLLWPLPETTLVSLCGRSLDFIRPHLQPGARILALTSGSSAPGAIAELLCSAGFGKSHLTILEALGGPRERVRSTRADEFNFDLIAALNTVAIEVAADSTARILSRTAGRADELFEHDGQITKREIRAVTLSALAPRRGEHLWDVGAGSGSVAIEWMLADPSMSASAIERRSDRAARIRRNAAACGVPDLQVLETVAPQSLDALQRPNAVFIGGGAGTAGMVETVQAALRTDGRLVINAVTLETEAILLSMQAQHGGTLMRMEIQRASPIGSEAARSSSWRPAMPITQWTWVKR